MAAGMCGRGAGVGAGGAGVGAGVVLVWCSGVQGCRGTMTDKEYLFTCFVGV